MVTRSGWRLDVLAAGALAFVVFAGSAPASAQSSAPATGSVVTTVGSPSAAASGPASTAPAPVTRVTATAITKTSVTISWVNPTSASSAGVMIRRTTGSVPASSPTSGSLVADVRRPGSRVVSGGLAPGVTYTYALFAHDAFGHYAARASITASTKAANGPLSWGPERRIDCARGGLNAVSCAAVSFCMAVDVNGNASIFNGTAWASPAPVVDVVDSDFLRDVPACRRHSAWR